MSLNMESPDQDHQHDTLHEISFLNSSTILNLGYERNSSSSNDSELLCRICYCPIDKEEIKEYCNCKGSVGIVHKQCLLKWLFESASSQCEICNFQFDIIENYKFNRRIIYLGLCVILWIGGFCVFLILKYHEHFSLILTILCVLGFISVMFIKNTNECYVLNSLDLNEKTENSRLLT
jgi:E3 ubiquitin-protein ligase DOA10